MPRKKAEEIKSPVTGVSVAGPKAPKPKAVSSKPAAAAASQTSPEAAAMKINPANGDSIFNLTEAVNGHVTPEQVAERAYFRWLERGCPMGTADEDWFYAERELTLSR